MKDFTGIHELSSQVALLGGAGKRCQKRQKPPAVPRRGIIREGFPQRQIPGSGRARQSGRIGRKKGEGPGIVFSIFRQMKSDPPHHVPEWIEFLQVPGHILSGTSGLATNMMNQSLPHFLQSAGREILQSCHGWTGIDQSEEIFPVGGRHGDRFTSFGSRFPAQMRQAAPGKIAPEGEVGGKDV